MSTTTNHEISLQQAIDMTSQYRQKRPPDFPICETFEKDAINTLLSVAGCAFLRIYYGMKADGLVDAILVAADASGKDLLPAASPSAAVTTDEPVILEDGYRCPDDCPVASALNS